MKMDCQKGTVCQFYEVIMIYVIQTVFSKELYCLYIMELTAVLLKRWACRRCVLCYVIYN